MVTAQAGPVITRYEIEPATGVKGSQIVNLAKDLARALSLVSIRVVETIPGKNLMGLELPNPRRQMVRLEEIVGSQTYHSSASLLTLALGKDIAGKPVVADLAKMPHLLVAGTTGSGKSVGINAMILSLLYKADPADVRLILIDPKMLEMSVYQGIPHLLAPVVTDMRLASNALNWCVGEMEKRYRLMSKMGVRNLAGYNAKIRDAIKREEPIPNPFSLTPDAPEPLSPLPTIVVVIDELADMMMIVGKKVEELIARLAQKARAAGIHLILATQRPSVDVITGLIKANIPTRIAFQVSSKIDSRTILDQSGAEALLGNGDMLYLPPGTAMPDRVHGAFVSDEEVHRVVEHLKEHGEPDYIEGLLEGGLDGDSGDGVSPRHGHGGRGVRSAVRPGRSSRSQEPPRLHLFSAAPSADWLQPCGAVTGTDGAIGYRVGDAVQWQPRDPGSRSGRPRGSLMKTLRRLAAVAALTLAPAVALAASAQEQLRAFVATVTAATGSFSQYTVNNQGRTQPAQTGVFSFQRPGKFKWAVQRPYEQLVISDGRKVFQFDPDLAGDGAQGGRRDPGTSPAAILFGSGSLEQSFDVSALPSRDGVDWLRAKPRTADAGFSRVDIGMKKNNPARARGTAGLVRPDHPRGPVRRRRQPAAAGLGIPVRRAQGVDVMKM